MPEETPPRRNRLIVAMLVMLPVWLIASTVFSMWIWTRPDRTTAEPVKFATPVNAAALAEDVRKLVEVVGPRGAASNDGARGLRRAAAMIEGSLGPANAGYRMDVKPGPETAGGSWPVIVAQLPGDDRAALWVVAVYDTLRGGVEANATGVASVLAAAQALAGEKPGRPVNFAFLPHGYEEEAPLLPLLEGLDRRMGEVEALLVVEAMGAAGELMISSRDAVLVANGVFEKHGAISGAEVVCLEDYVDLASVWFEKGRPAVRVATRRVVGPDELDDALPDAESHATATAALVGLIRELASR